MRSLLTMLGIIISIVAVITLVNPVNEYMGSMVENFASMGASQINVDVANLTSRPLDVDRMYAFYEEHTDLFGELSPDVTLSFIIKYGDDSMTSTSVVGRSKQYLGIKSYELETGRNVVYSDVISHQKVYVIGAYVVNEFYGSTQNATEQTLKIDNYTFKIIGAAKAQDKGNVEDGGTDSFVWIPYSVATEMSRSTNVSNYTFTVLDTNKADECITVVKSFLYETFKDEGPYRVTAMSEMLDSLSEWITMMNGMLGGIAGVSLLIAGVGAMNIVLVPVTERIRKIGIRKSLGAGKGTIIWRFAVEVVVTNSMGGVIGTLVGCAAAAVVGAVAGVSATPTLSAVIISFSVFVGIGLLFGYMPTNQTASLNPIDALRSE